MRLYIPSQISSIVTQCLGLVLGLTIAGQAAAAPSTVTSEPTLSDASSFTNPCGLTPPVLSPTSTTVVQGAAAVSITANGCPGGIIQYFNNFGNPAGVFTIAPGGTISVPTNLTGVVIISTLCSAQGCTSDVSTASVTVLPSTPSNTPPIVSNAIPNQTAIVGSNIVFVLPANTFTDPNNDPLTLTASGLPSGLFFNGSAFTGPVSQIGTSTITVTATNAHNLSVSTSFVLSVLPGTPAVNQPPIVVGSGLNSPQSAILSSAFSTPTAYAFSDPENGPLTFSSNSLPPNLTINPSTGVITGTPIVNGQFGVTITATDNGGLNVNTGFILNIGLDPNVNYPVVLVGAGLSSPQQGTKGVSLTIPTAYGFKDPEGRALTFFTSPLPSGLSINPSTGVISGTPSVYGQSGITVGATDDGGSTVYSGFFLTLDLNPNINEAPVVVGSGIDTPQTGVTGSGITIPTAYAFSDPEGRALTYISSPLPAGLTLNPSTGVINGTPTGYGQSGITIGATDDAGNTVYSGFFLTITLDPNVNYPVYATNNGVSDPKTGTVGVLVSIATAPYFVDPEGRALTFFSSPLPPGLTLNPATGQISGIPTQAGQFGITIGVTDDGGNQAYSGFLYTVSPSGGRVGSSSEPGSTLAVTVFGNPTAGETVDIEISGVAGQTVSIQTIDAHGQSMSKSSIAQAGTQERTTVRLGQAPGLYLLQVNTVDQRKVIKVLKQ